MNDKQTLFNQIREYGFAVLELTLYLDTHPTCMNALMLHNKYVALLNESKTMYETNYGPLTADYTVGNSWTWINDPWPWEVCEVK